MRSFNFPSSGNHWFATKKKNCYIQHEDMMNCDSATAWNLMEIFPLVPKKWIKFPIIHLLLSAAINFGDRGFSTGTVSIRPNFAISNCFKNAESIDSIQNNIRIRYINRTMMPVESGWVRLVRYIVNENACCFSSSPFSSSSSSFFNNFYQIKSNAKMKCYNFWNEPNQNSCNCKMDSNTELSLKNLHFQLC